MLVAAIPVLAGRHSSEAFSAVIEGATGKDALETAMRTAAPHRQESSFRAAFLRRNKKCIGLP
jgi:hypothetical protein